MVGHRDVVTVVWLVTEMWSVLRVCGTAEALLRPCLVVSVLSQELGSAAAVSQAVSSCTAEQHLTGWEGPGPQGSSRQSLRSLLWFRLLMLTIVLLLEH